VKSLIKDLKRFSGRRPYAALAACFERSRNPNSRRIGAKERKVFGKVFTTDFNEPSCSSNLKG
jgi:hypothetical protein